VNNIAALVEWLEQAGIQDPEVLAAMKKVPREQFVPEHLKHFAYEDEALPIDCGQTISQPFVVARMTELILQPGYRNRVLEIGTGSGYQAAVLCHLFKEVYTVERVETLLQQAQTRFKQLGYKNIDTDYADGFNGWPSAAPFDAIIVTAAAPRIPPALLEQLADGAKMIIPVGDSGTTQYLKQVIRQGDHYDIESLDAVVFVPMLPGKEG